MVDSGCEGTPQGPLFAAAAPARIVLSETSDLWGVSPTGWVAALFLFGAVAAGTFFAWQVAPQPAWPSDPVLVRLVFEEPAAPAAEVMAAPAPSEPASAPPVAPPETAPPAPAQDATATEVEPEPPPIATPQPAVTPLPKPPSRKPALRHAAAPPPVAEPSAVAAESGSTSSATTQTAALPSATAPGVRSSVLQPSLDYGAKPDYPAAARVRGLQGRVLLRIDVAANGALADVAVITSSGHAILDKAALAWVRAQRFRPAMRDGKAIDGEVDLPVEFRLEN